MFDNYTNLNPNYIPNNIEPKSIEDRKEFEKEDTQYKRIYNINNVLIGYQYYYDQEVYLPVELKDYIYIEESSYVNNLYSSITNVAPTTSTSAKYGERFYNIYDYKVWVCTSVGQTTYRWELQKEFTYPSNGVRVNVTNRGNSYSYKIYDYNGVVVKEGATNSASQTIKMPKLLPNVYTIKFFAGFDNQVVMWYNINVIDTRNSYNKNIND